MNDAYSARKTALKGSMKKAGSGDAADPRFEPVAKALSKMPGFSLMQSKSQAMRGMVFDSQSFGMSHHGRFILKLDEKRVSAHVAAGTGEPFRPGPDKVMKGWLEVTDPKANWVKLAKEAYALAKAGAKPKPKAKPR